MEPADYVAFDDVLRDLNLWRDARKMRRKMNPRTLQGWFDTGRFPGAVQRDGNWFVAADVWNDMIASGNLAALEAARRAHNFALNQALERRRAGIYENVNMIRHGASPKTPLLPGLVFDRGADAYRTIQCRIRQRSHAKKPHLAPIIYRHLDGSMPRIFRGILYVHGDMHYWTTRPGTYDQSGISPKRRPIREFTIRGATLAQDSE